MLTDRMVFIENEKGEKIATATAYYDVIHSDVCIHSGECTHSDEDADGRSSGWLHWVAVRREYQGKGLSKPLISHVLGIMQKLGYTHATIPTQTTTWLACKIYLDLGFRPIPENAVSNREGWRIVRALTNHEALGSFDAAGIDEILMK